MLRNLLLSSAAFAALTSASLAADLPSRKAPPAAPYVAAPIFTWTGFYIGADIGAGWTNDKARDYVTATNVYNGSSKLNGSGVLGGLYAGYNYQISPSFLIGAEVDIEATSIAPKTSSFTTAAGVVGVLAGSISESLPWQGSLRARAGVTAGQALFYATGGLAFAQFNTKYTDNAVGATSYSSTKTGWTLGAGVEYAFNANWIARVEYRYTSFGNFNDSVAANGSIFASQTLKHSVTENAVRVGIAYKFGAPASAVVAKY